MNLIVAADKNWAIGNKGRLLVTIPEDQKLFRQETLGKVIVRGRKTMESLPGGQALPGRTNVVLTRNRDYKKKGVTAVHGMDEALSFLKQTTISISSAARRSTASSFPIAGRLM